MSIRPKQRSILERASIRSLLAPKAESNQVLIFSSIGTYDDTTDIMTVHKYVIESFQKERDRVEDLKKEIQRIKETIATSKLRIVDLRYYQDQIDTLEKQIKESTSDQRQNEYLRRIKELRDEWAMIKHEEGPNFKFGKKTEFSPNKLSLIRNYIQIASEFVPLDLTLKQEGMEKKCPYCRKDFGDEEGKIVCYDCGIYQDALTHEAEYNDRSHVNTGSTNGYMNKETFTKTLDCYQGRQRIEFPSELSARFNDYCKFRGKNKATLNYELTRPIFKEIGFSCHFDDINLFLSMHPEIKKPLPDLSKMEDVILQDYDQFSAKYPEVKGDERDSSLNAWYLLYILCRRRKIPCNRSDLKMPDTLEIRISNDRIARKVFEALGWKFEDTV